MYEGFPDMVTVDDGLITEMNVAGYDPSRVGEIEGVWGVSDCFLSLEVQHWITGDLF